MPVQVQASVQTNSMSDQVQRHRAILLESRNAYTLEYYGNGVGIHWARVGLVLGYVGFVKVEMCCTVNRFCVGMYS